MSSELLPPLLPPPYRTPWRPPGPPPWYRRLLAWGHEHWRIINGDAERELEQRALASRRDFLEMRRTSDAQYRLGY